ncbi:hypothetical protein RHGRI_014801 [Rhododendron griersonianum]|uniref:Protein TIC 20 n=1 Tax=Rhododendron griersonianum TaxID=479676 RepID=A0AAV6KAU7_9ERIC|nr:hypothetical protein RHGRI_014801 [Rhododendron griersonianum]
MASSPLLRLSLLPLHPTNLSPHPLRSPFAPTPLPRTRSNLTHTTAATWPPRRTAKTTTCMSSYNNNSTTPATDRLVSAVAYVLPLIKGLSYGRFLYAKYPTLATSLEPILPLLNLYHSIPYASLVSFFALYLGVARNPRLSRYVRFGSLAGVQSCSGHFEFDICTILWKGELPAGRTAARSTSSAFPFQDTEIERELNELRRKAQDF